MTEPHTAHVQYHENWPHPPTFTVDGVDMTEKVKAGSLKIQHRAGKPPLVTFSLVADASFDGAADVRTSAITTQQLSDMHASLVVALDHGIDPAVVRRAAEDAGFVWVREVAGGE
jgi:hypothetical protein